MLDSQPHCSLGYEGPMCTYSSGVLLTGVKIALRAQGIRPRPTEGSVEQCWHLRCHSVVLPVRIGLNFALWHTEGSL